MKTIKKLFSILILLTIMIGFVTPIIVSQPAVVLAQVQPLQSEMGIEQIEPIEPMVPFVEGDIWPIFFTLNVNWNK